MVTIKGILKDNRNEAGSIKKQIRYSQAQIKKKPAKMGSQRIQRSY